MTSRASRQTGILAWLTQAELPIFLLDHRRRVRFFNNSAENFFSCTTGDVIGKICNYSAIEKESSPVQKVLQKIAPPPEIFEKSLLTHPLNFSPHPSAQLFFLNLGLKQEHPTILGIVLNQDAANYTGESPAQKIHKRLEELLESRLAQLTEKYRQGQKSQSLIAVSPEMQLAQKQWGIALNSELPVFIFGERGTGKSSWIKSLHYQSKFGDQELITFHEKDFEHEHLKQQLMLLSKMHDGSSMAGGILIEELELMPRDSQQVLLDYFHKYSNSIPLRIYTTSHYAPDELIKQNIIIKELVYLLTPFTIYLPPLRKRTADLELLPQYFLEMCNHENEHQSGGFSSEVITDFYKYSWSGNVQELKSIIEESHANSKTPLIEKQDLPMRFRMGWKTQALGPRTNLPEAFNLEQMLLQHEKEWVIWALEATSDNKAAAAQLLGMTRPRFYRRLEALGLIDQSPDENTDSDQH